MHTCVLTVVVVSIALVTVECNCVIEKHFPTHGGCYAGTIGASRSVLSVAHCNQLCHEENVKRGSKVCLYFVFWKNGRCSLKSGACKTTRDDDFDAQTYKLTDCIGTCD